PGLVRELPYERAQEPGIVRELDAATGLETIAQGLDARRARGVLGGQHRRLDQDLGRHPVEPRESQLVVARGQTRASERAIDAGEREVQPRPVLAQAERALERLESLMGEAQRLIRV